MNHIRLALLIHLWYHWRNLNYRLTQMLQCHETLNFIWTYLLFCYSTTDLKVHAQIISVIKRHSNDQSLTFSSHNLKNHLYYKILNGIRIPQNLSLKMLMLTWHLVDKQPYLSLTWKLWSCHYYPTLMQPKNIAHGYDLFTGKCEGNNTDDRYGEIHTADAWEPAWQQFCGDDNPINMPIALVIFGDKSRLDLHGSLSTLPIMFTLLCFNQESRNKDEIWCPLAFLTNLSYEALYLEEP